MCVCVCVRERERESRVFYRERDVNTHGCEFVREREIAKGVENRACVCVCVCLFVCVCVCGKRAIKAGFARGMHELPLPVLDPRTAHKISKSVLSKV